MIDVTTKVISNATLSATYNGLWQKYDTDDNNYIDFREFYDLTKESAAWAVRGFITEDDVLSVYNNVAGGEPITRKQMAEFILTETGIDIEAKADKKIETVIGEHNGKVEQQEKAKSHKKSWLELVADGVNAQSNQYHEAVEEKRKKNKKMGFCESVGYTYISF